MLHSANAFADALRKNAARIIMIFLMTCILAASIIIDTKLSFEKTKDIYISSTPEDPEMSDSDHEIGEAETAGIFENTVSADIRIPHCDTILYSASDGKNDFSFTNPKTNECYLKVSITRRDTSETIYSSTLISPGNSVSDIVFSKRFSKPGAYEVMIKVDAYSKIGFGFNLLNSLVMETEISVY